MRLKGYYVEDREKLRTLLDFVRTLPDLCWTTASAPFAGEQYRMGYEDGKETVCLNVEDAVHNLLLELENGKSA